MSANPSSPNTYFVHWQIKTSDKTKHTGKLPVSSLRAKEIWQDRVAQEVQEAVRNSQSRINLDSLDWRTLALTMPVSFLRPGATQAQRSLSFRLSYDQLPLQGESVLALIFITLNRQLDDATYGGDEGRFLGDVRTLTELIDGDPVTQAYNKATGGFPINPKWSLYCGQEEVAISSVQTTKHKSYYSFDQTVSFQTIYDADDPRAQVGPLIRGISYNKSTRSKTVYNTVKYGVAV